MMEVHTFVGLASYYCRFVKGFTSIAMDFIVGLPKTLGKYDSIWVIVDRMMKSTHFIPIQVIYNAEKLAKIYLKEIVWLHGVPDFIISDKGTQFTCTF